MISNNNVINSNSFENIVYLRLWSELARLMGNEDHDLETASLINYSCGHWFDLWNALGSFDLFCSLNARNSQESLKALDTLDTPVIVQLSALNYAILFQS